MHKTTPPATSSLPQITIRRHLVSLSTVQAALDRDRQFALGLIENGTLRGFNLALDPNSSPVFRVFASDLAAFQRGERKPPAGFEDALRIIFPMQTEARPGTVSTIKVCTLRRRLGVRHGHVYNLIRAGSLQLKPGARARRGPTGSPEVLFASVAKFLRDRYAA